MRKPVLLAALGTLAFDLIPMASADSFKPWLEVLNMAVATSRI